MSDPVSVPGLPFELRPEGPADGATWHVDGGALVMTARSGTDRFNDPATGVPGEADAARLVAILEGDFQVSARVSVEFAEQFDAGVLWVAAADDVWAKLCFEYTPQHTPSIVSVVTRGDSDDANAEVLEGGRTWLRVSRIGRAVAFHASHDGAWWRMIRYFSFGAAAGATSATESLRVGFLAQSPMGEGCRVVFDEIRYRAETLTDLRDGS